MSNKKEKQTFKQIGEDLANIDKNILDLFERHEYRLQGLETVILQAGLHIILQKINRISDVDKRNVTLACFMELIDTLGIRDLEAL